MLPLALHHARTVVVPVHQRNGQQERQKAPQDKRNKGIWEIDKLARGKEVH